MAQDVKAIIEEYKKNPDILYVQPTYLRAIQATAGPDIVTYIGVETQFKGIGSSPESEIARYAWDFDGDGKDDYESEKSGSTTFVFEEPGVYYARFTIWDRHSVMDIDKIRVRVLEGDGEPRFEEEPEFPRRNDNDEVNSDCNINRYAVMFNGGSEPRFWNDVTFMYSTLQIQLYAKSNVLLR